MTDTCGTTSLVGVGPELTVATLELVDVIALVSSESSDVRSMTSDVRPRPLDGHKAV